MFPIRVELRCFNQRCMAKVIDSRWPCPSCLQQKTKTEVVLTSMEESASSPVQLRGTTCQCRCPCHNHYDPTWHAQLHNGHIESEPATLIVSETIEVNTMNTSSTRDPHAYGNIKLSSRTTKDEPQNSPSPLDATFSKSFLHVKNIVRNMTARWESLKVEDRSGYTSYKPPRQKGKGRNSSELKLSSVNPETLNENFVEQPRKKLDNTQADDRRLHNVYTTFERSLCQQPNRGCGYKNLENPHQTEDLIQLNEPIGAPTLPSHQRAKHAEKRFKDEADKVEEGVDYQNMDVSSSPSSLSNEDRSKGVIKMKDEDILPSLHSPNERNVSQVKKTDQMLALEWHGANDSTRTRGKSEENAYSAEDSSKSMTGSYHHQVSRREHSAKANKSSRSGSNSIVNVGEHDEKKKTASIKKLEDSTKLRSSKKKECRLRSSGNEPIPNGRENNYGRSLDPRKQLDRPKSPDKQPKNKRIPKNDQKAQIGHSGSNSFDLGTNDVTTQGHPRKEPHKEKKASIDRNKQNDQKGSKEISVDKGESSPLDGMVKAAMKLTDPKSLKETTTYALEYEIHTEPNSVLAAMSKDFDEVRATPSTLYIDSIGQSLSISRDPCDKIGSKACSSKYPDQMLAFGKSGESWNANVCKSYPSSTRGCRGRKEFYICEKCQRVVQSSEASLYTKGGRELAWHPYCFTCSTCDKPLLDIHHSFVDDKPYCTKHSSFVGDMPNCFKCQELILDSKYTSAAGNFWHLEHFTCRACEKPLVDAKYILDKKKDPYCLACHETRFPKLCMSCQRKISPLDPCVQGGSLNWHSNSNCLQCSRCETSLVGRPVFFRKGGDLYCNKYCALLKKQFSTW